MTAIDSPMARISLFDLAWSAFTRLACPHGAAQRAVEFMHHPLERRRQSGSPPDQHIIMPRPKRIARHPDHFAQPAADAIALDGVTDLL